jgi:hypothetical protein
MKFTINPFFEIADKEIISIANNFNSEGILFGDGKRNKIKIFEIEGKTINIKSFKIPHLINKIAYKYFRKSKARRSFEYGTILLEKGIGTPQPIAYFENHDIIGIKDSYYVSEHLNCDFTFRELVENPDFLDHENILRQFTRFSFGLHEKGIEFLDHSPGNTLIKKKSEGNYDFFLVDLNRMNFHKVMSFDLRMKNLSHLTVNKKIINVISNEYSKHFAVQSDAVIFEKICFYTDDFQKRLRRKKLLKKKLKFWKN